MSTARSCKPCRDSKIKCDLQRPVCGACIKRNVTCEGYATDSEYRFRGQNETARDNSERARRGRKHLTQPVTLALTRSEVDLGQERDPTTLARKAMPWLKEGASISVDSFPTYSIEERAREIFYREWILHPDNQGFCPGYLDILPAMKAGTSSDSVLSLAIDAFALANIQKFTISNGNLRHIAWTRYGKALTALRKVISEHNGETSDQTLLAILVIDTFEVIFTAREEPLGLHSGAIEHVLTARKMRNISSSTGFNLYRLAHHRLQSRQLILGLDPLPVQLECIDLLDTADASVGLGRILLKEQHVLALTFELLATDPGTLVNLEHQASTIIHQIRLVLNELKVRLEQTALSWHPQYLQVAEHEGIQQFFQKASLQAISQVRLYHDPWVAYQMNFCNQGQLALRSAFLNIILRVVDTTPPASWSEGWLQEADAQKSAVVELATALVESIPPLIGATELEGAKLEFCQGKKISRCFARTACWALREMQHIPLEHKTLSNSALSWMQQLESLD